ncbi:MAG TPA: OmpH family outer membrane protein [Candidatus Angelobacter sp.]|nr:OmpH family outer membrane protein [Candidatus Angelobacter sp.]
MSMSKIQILALSFGLSAAFSPAVFAQAAAAPVSAPGPAATTPGPAPTRIGVLNIQEAILASEEGKKEFDALQQKFGPKQAELKAQNDEVEKMKKDLETQGPKLNDDERTARARTIETKQKALQRNFEDAQAEYQQQESELANRIGAKMLVTLQKYSETHGYAVVLDVSNPQTSPVLWATQGTVITKELVDAYNAENPAGAPAARPAGAAATRPAAPAPKTTTPPAAPTPKKQ